MTRCELVKGLRVAEPMVSSQRGDSKVWGPNDTKLQERQEPKSSFLVLLFCADPKQVGQCAPTWQPSASQAQTPPRTRADGAPHSPIRLMHKLALLPPLSVQSLHLGLHRREVAS